MTLSLRHKLTLVHIGCIVVVVALVRLKAQRSSMSH